MPEGIKTKHIPHASGGENNLNNPMYSTGIGLILHGSMNGSERVFYGDLFNGIFDRMKEWVGNLFGVNGHDLRGKTVTMKQRV